MSYSSSLNATRANVTLAAIIASNRFVEADGTYPTSGGTAFGILERNGGGVSGDVKAAVISGYAAVLSDDTIAKGANVSTTATGKAKTTVSTEEILGQAIDAASADEMVRVQFDKAGVLA